MNRVCPPCGHDFATDGFPDDGTVPYEENDRIGTLQFCSEECRDGYKQGEGR